MAQEFNKEQALDELDKLDKRIEIILKDINYLKKKVESDGKLSSDDLDITITDIDQVAKILSNRRDVGH